MKKFLASILVPAWEAVEEVWFWIEDHTVGLGTWVGDLRFAITRRVYLFAWEAEAL